LRDKTLPPSKFSKLILDYMDACPLSERGWRPMFDIVEWHERETHRKQLFKGFRAVYMNQHQYVKFLMGKEEGLLEVDGRARWEKRKREVPEEDWDYGGETNDILELPIVTEKYIDASKGVMHDKQMDLSGKKQKIRHERQLEEGRSELSRGLCDFDAEMFDGVGGGAMKGVLTGAQLHDAQEKGKVPQATPGAAVAFDSKDDKKAKKDFDLDKAGINLKIFIRKQIDSLKEQLNKVQEQVSTSSQLATVAVDVPNMGEYVTLLERRHHFMTIMFLTYAEQEDHGGAAELGLENINIADFNRTETDGKDLQAVIDKVNNWQKVTEAKTQSVASSSSGLDGSSQIVEQQIAWVRSWTHIPKRS